MHRIEQNPQAPFPYGFLVQNLQNVVDEGVERILNLLNYDNSFKLVMPEDGYYLLKATE